MDNLDIFKGKRVLVTGSTGFKGSWLCIWLKNLGADVYGYALPPATQKDNYVICGVEKEISQMNGDVRFDTLGDYVRDIDPQFIFHLAAQPIVLASYEDPQYTFETNIMGTVNLLDAARKLKNLISIVIVTSDKCYKNSGNVLSEEDKLGGDDPYSASKACEELVATSFYKSFFSKMNVGLSTARAGNVIGGGDCSENRIVPDIIRSIDSGEDITIRNPQHIRPWQYVLEPLYGYLKLAVRMAADPGFYSGAWNFGPDADSHITVRHLVELMIRDAHVLSGKDPIGLVLGDDAKAEKEKSILAIDSSKASKFLDMYNVLSIQDVCQFTVEDYLCEDNFLKQRTDRIDKYQEEVKNEL